MDQLNYVGDTSGDDLLNVTFYEMTDDSGVTQEYINIRVPGDATLDFHAVLDDTYRERFARRYEAYKAMHADGGTPIETWTDLPMSTRREFVYLGFRTVEQVATAPDSAFARIMGGPTIRLKAQAFLNRGKVSTDEVIAKQQAEIDELKSALTELLAVKRGRPAREVEAA